MYPKGTSKGLPLVYKILQLRNVLGWVASCAAEPRGVVD